MAGVNYQTELIKMYLAAFIRAPEKSGLDYWLLQLANGKSFENVLETVFSLDIVKAIYPEGLTNDSFVTLIYVNVFGKSPDVEGLKYWSAELANGSSRGKLVMTMINTGLATPDGTLGKAYIVNRLSVAQFAVDQQNVQRADFSPSYLKSLMSSVNADPTTITIAKNAMNSSVTGIGLGAPVNAIAVAAAADGISSNEVKAGISVVVDLKGTNAAVNNVLELLLDRVSFTVPVTKILTDADIKAQKVTLLVPAGTNWGNDGSKLLNVYVRDTNGVQGLAGGDLNVILNQLPPGTPTNPISIAVASNGINAIEKSAGVVVKVDLAGTQAFAGDKIEVLNGGQVFSPTASAVLTETDVKAGYVMITISGAANWGLDGEKTLAARVTDISGNIGGVGGALTVNLDATIPTALSNPLVMPVSTGGISPSEKAGVVEVIVNLSGTNTQVGDSVELLIDGKPFTNTTMHILTASEITNKSATVTIAPNDAAWGSTDGDRIITARFFDVAGNVSLASGNLKVTLDSVPPNSQNSSLTVAAALNGISAAEIAAGVDVVVNLTGTNALVGDLVSIMIDGANFSPVVSTVLKAAQVTANSATITIPAGAVWGLDGIKTLTATVTDAAGNLGLAGGALSLTVDTKAPNAPTNALSVAAATNGISLSEKTAGVAVLVDLTGTSAVAGDSVEILMGGAALTPQILQTLSGTDISNGFATVTIPGTAAWGIDGTKLISARVLDIAGNIGASSASLSVTLDTVAPAGPTNALSVAANAGGGISLTERAAGVAVVVSLAGTSATAGDTVELLVGGMAFTAPVKFTLTPTEITAQSVTLTIGTNDGWGADGNKILTARFIDPAGNLGTAAGSVTVALDGSPPGAVANTLTIPASTNGINNTEKTAGVSVSVDLTGTSASAGDTLNLLLNGLAFSTPVTQVLTPAQITAKLATLIIPSGAGWGTDGSKVLTASITDTLGNASLPGGANTILLDTTAPTAPSNALVVAAAAAGINASELAAGVNVLVDLTGTGAVSGDKLEILLGGAAFTTPVVQTIGSTDITNGFVNIVVPSAAGWGTDGSKNLTARITDFAGNTGTAGSVLSVTLDTAAPTGPSSPLVVAANGGGGITAAEKTAGVNVDVDLTGTASVAGDVIEILIGGSSFTTPVTHTITGAEVTAKLASLTISSGSGWGADGAKTLTAKITDAAGNASLATGSVSVTILDTTPPTAPSAAMTVAAATNGINATEKAAGVTVAASLSGTSAVAGDIASLFIDGVAFSTPVTHVLSGAEITAGTFDFTVPGSAIWGAEGNHTLTYGVTDLAGNVGAKAGSVTVSLDTTAPTAPSNAVVVAVAASGINAAEKTAGVVATVDLAGTGAVANDSLEILLAGASFTAPVLYTLTGAEILAGSASVTIPSGAGWGSDGVKNISARVIDVAGNAGAIGGSLTTTLETSMPAAVGLPAYSDLDTSGTVSAGDTYVFTISEATNKAITLANLTITNGHLFGTGATATWSSDGTQLTLLLGTGTTVAGGDIITLVGVSDSSGNSLNLAFSI